jgi:hypothetical protein
MGHTDGRIPGQRPVRPHPPLHSAIGGRYAEIFVAVNDGWVAPAGQPPTVEELVAHLDVVEDRSAHSVPHNTFDEIAIAKRRIDSEIGTATIDGGMPVLK